MKTKTNTHGKKWNGKKKSKRRKNVFVMALDGRRRQVDCLLMMIHVWVLWLPQCTVYVYCERNNRKIWSTYIHICFNRRTHTLSHTRSSLSFSDISKKRTDEKRKWNLHKAVHEPITHCRLHSRPLWIFFVCLFWKFVFYFVGLFHFSTIPFL